MSLKSISSAGILAVVSVVGALGIGTAIAGVSPTVSVSLPAVISVSTRAAQRGALQYEAVPDVGDSALASSSSSSVKGVPSLLQVSPENNLFGYGPSGKGLADGDGTRTRKLLDGS